MSKQQTLQEPLSKLSFSKEFLEMADKNNFHNLEEILRLRSYEMRELPLFGYRMFYELLTILEDNGLQSELKDG